MPSITSMTKKREHFRRYTNLAATIDLLHSKRIKLLNPRLWDDRNDAFFMEEYRAYKGAKTILALCFAESNETYHHWRVFSNGSDGVCLEFNKGKLLSAFNCEPGVRSAKVSYKLMSRTDELTPSDLDNLPFMKRHPFKDEREFRVIYVDDSEVLPYKDFSIDLAWIERVILNPWMPENLATSVITALRSLPGCENISIDQSNLIDNPMWKRIATRLRAAIIE